MMEEINKIKNKTYQIDTLLSRVDKLFATLKNNVFELPTIDLKVDIESVVANIWQFFNLCQEEFESIKSSVLELEKFINIDCVTVCSDIVTNEYHKDNECTVNGEADTDHTNDNTDYPQSQTQLCKQLKNNGEKDQSVSRKIVKQMAANEMFKGKRQKRIFQCCYCDQCFTAASILKCHIKEFHVAENSDKPYSSDDRVLNDTMQQLEGNDKWQCRQCKKEFTQSCHLRRHIHSVHIKEGLICLLCGLFYAKKHALKKHMKTKHQSLNQQPQKAEEIKQVMEDNVDLIHVKQEKIDDIESSNSSSEELKTLGQSGNDCPKCGRHFTQVGHLRRHFRSVHLGERKFSCMVCGKCYAENSGLKKHIKKHHANILDIADELVISTKEVMGEKLEKNAEVATPAEIGTENDKATFQCEKCYQIFSSSHALHRHKMEHNRDYKCYKCSIPFINRFEYASHIKKHINESEKSNTLDKLFACSCCDETFVHNSELKLHDRNVHAPQKRSSKKHRGTDADLSQTKLKTHTCVTCGKGFKLLRSLNLHMHTVHMGERPCICEICGKSFARSTSLQYHIKSQHSTERPYKCSYCEKGFAYAATLRDHQKVHTGEKPFQCEECGKSFSQATSLRCHLISHSGEKTYSCNVCLMMFKYQTGLKRHQLRHTGKRPYECPQCCKRFFEKRAMEDHHRSHTGERPYACRVCKKTFSSKTHLNRHEKNVCKINQSRDSRHSIQAVVGNSFNNSAKNNLGNMDRMQPIVNAPLIMTTTTDSRHVDSGIANGNGSIPDINVQDERQSQYQLFVNPNYYPVSFHNYSSS